ncbi:hypothetical protein EGM51_01530 [Verrucomicrobia bacterium S94]|nr:hypothetical protein EGM51_01530 [Verrucomicrobia bacterium S94]
MSCDKCYGRVREGTQFVFNQVKFRDALYGVLCRRVSRNVLELTAGVYPAGCMYDGRFFFGMLWAIKPVWVRSVAVGLQHPV